MPRAWATSSQSFFLSPKEPVGGWILGGGPVFCGPPRPTALLGSGKWGAGPTVRRAAAEHGWTYGALANQIWSYATGWGPHAETAVQVNATFLQPFVAYTTKTYTTFGLNTESTYDWSHSHGPCR